MNKIKNLFPKIYDFENLFGAYKDGIKQKRDRPDVMAYTEKLEENLINLQNEFIWLTYKVGRYRMFFVYEPKKRLIMALDFKDRVANLCLGFRSVVRVSTTLPTVGRPLSI